MSIDRESITLEVPTVRNAPGESAARSKKFRLFSGSSSMVRLSITSHRRGVGLQLGSGALTSTFSLIFPTCMLMSARSSRIDGSTSFDTVAVRNEGAAAVMV